MYENNNLMCALKQINTSDGMDIGKISKQWGGILREMYTNADNFSLTCKYSRSLKR